jgi:hypothetical protein
MRKTLCASVLVLVLCGSVFAGDIECPPIVAPGDISSPPSAPQSSSNQTADGWIGTGTAAPTTDSSIHGDNSGSLTQIALDLLSVLPSLL